MMQLRCGDVVPGCSAVFHGQSVDEILRQAVAHAGRDHGIHEITPEVAAAVRGAIHEVPAEG
jgi:predicted small metal-binding protein